MKEVQDLPEEGQFVVVWEYNNKIWSDTFKREGEIILNYNGVEDKFEEESGLEDWSWYSDDRSNKKIFVTE